MAIIQSVLDTDLYKFTTSYAYSKLYPRAYGQFRFIDRGKTTYPQGFAEELKKEIQEMSKLALTKDEASFLYRELPYLPPTYIDFVRGFRFDPEEVKVEQDTEGHLSIIAEGLLYRVTLWETPILALVSELYYKILGAQPDMEYTERTIISKARKLAEHGITFSMFGMRRRFSAAIEDRVTELLKEHAAGYLFGTSNVYYAYKHGLRVSGTHPHEWIQFHGAMFGYKMANYMAMEDWINVYDGDLGTVLTDTYTTDVFMRNFSKKHAMLFTSLRHDSGDPLQFTEKVIARYRELRVDPTIKYIIFSDGLDPERAIEIANYCKGRIGASFGIGTNFSNDVGNGVRPMNIVMKLWKCKMTEKERWNPCVKLSDVDGKHTGEPEEIELAQRTLGLPVQI
ncbi:MAG: nicotinate phosphoribosyltransferase [Porphyromonadaceae bacterium]|jgi:nicotinate phosphoribosyltransferase|uniref:nicotinate phosphoribosyltransferase n=1 Tax=Porphyromonas TaxID=836 RepID=UPI001C001A47|nr:MULTISPECIES: nicotinate phosphoribosyltransferase [Porphyromonas]MBF1317251.1 nicotinate phosphoribosyltransferase [Porphyromonadaceae bacterium]MBF1366626.1 nicotinate phosphoribosyltransferase [Porphyromonadaceae bacterium]MBF1372308.1 nicotinate phosphoribosyltransferase [Porphyromonadaceae bacterium]MBF1389685.1 nicotinate phosphoribosyltransferase [Porphyromonas sp.]MBF1413307.1 nicotinate phosphoribosyltransferase [Porphyromonas sp.]